jgi:diguanylate cyclase (GGDEF)-like protein
VLVLDARLRPVVVNAALRDLHGHDRPAPGEWPDAPDLRRPDGGPLPPGPGLFDRLRISGAVDGELIGVVNARTGRMRVARVTGRRLDTPDGGLLGLLLTIVDVTDQIEREQVLLELSETDELTGLLNRRGFARQAAELLGRADRPPVWVHAVDLVGLKAVNDTHGHLEGDHTLQVVARCLRSSAGPGSVVGRLGGDEFAVLTARHGLAERLETELAAAWRPAGLSSRPTATVGAVEGGAPAEDPAAQLDRLLAEADTAMYRLRARV